MRASFIKAIAVLAVASLGLAGCRDVEKKSDGTLEASGTVVRVIDGDTIDVNIAGKEERVRLLNVDTPETKHPDKPVQCLGQEATEYLKSVLPIGTEIRLQSDQVKKDKYDRYLAGVFKGSSLINAEIARVGLGVPVVFDGNTKFYDQVLEASTIAQQNQVGLFNPDIECTLAAQANHVVAGYSQSGALALTELDSAISSAELLEIFDTEAAFDVDGPELKRLYAAGLMVYGAKSIRDYSVNNYRRTKDMKNDLISLRVGTAKREANKREKTIAETSPAVRDSKDERPDSVEKPQRQTTESNSTSNDRRTQTKSSVAKTKPVHPNESKSAAKSKPKPAPKPKVQASPKPKPSHPAKPKPKPSVEKPGKGKRKGYGPLYPRHGGPPGYRGPRCFKPGGKFWQMC